MPAYALSDYLQFIASGISTGSIYVLIALGLITIYNVTGVINLAQGEFVMLGAMLAVMFSGLGLPLLLSAALAVLCAMAIGALVQRVTIHPARRASEVSLIMITIGSSIAIRGLALAAWGTTPYALPDFTVGEPLNILGAVVSRQRLWIMGTALVVLIVLFAYFEFTLSGKALRACAINRYTA
ncbi:MAG: branched-chain amino acid ABC transporter permease, partial [Anaerolineae bacterium]|nr:branched-chain amino acid ABC transporter permease [Anaerolineae bacterium]